MDLKECLRCHKEKPLTLFFKNKNKVDGLWNTCKECGKRQSAKWRKKNPRRHKRWSKLYRNSPNYQHSRLKWRLNFEYGLKIEEYNQLLKKQRGTCAICKQSPEKGKRLAVDHDHITGKVRGLLHTRCNVGLGCFKDDPKLVRNALGYLNKKVL